MQERNQTDLQQDLQVLPFNERGKDVVVGDLHGSLELLQKTLSYLKQDDRLIALGDFVDKGKSSALLLDYILANNADPTKPKVYGIKGNHEEMCSNTLLELENIVLSFYRRGINLNAETFQQAIAENDVIRLHGLGNGGAWFINLFIQELMEGKIHIENEMVCYAETSQFPRYEEYFQSLPFILRVEGKSGVSAPFTYTHADMILTDEEFKKRIAANEGLTEQEKQYALWARPVSAQSNLAFKNNGRDVTSTLVFGGHNIVLFGDNPAVRKEANMLHIDFGTYATGFLLVIGPSVSSVKVMGEVTAQNQAYLPKIKEVTKAYEELLLDNLKLQESILHRVSAKHSIAEVHEEIKKILAENNEFVRSMFANGMTYTNCLRYVINNDGIKHINPNIRSVADFTNHLNQPAAFFHPNTSNKREAPVPDEPNTSKRSKPGSEV